MAKKLRSVPAGRFKAQCLALLDEVAQTREPLVVTKRGKPVAKVVPVEDGIPSLHGSILWQGDLVSPIDVQWDASR